MKNSTKVATVKALASYNGLVSWKPLAIAYLNAFASQASAKGLATVNKERERVERGLTVSEALRKIDGYKRNNLITRFERSLYNDLATAFVSASKQSKDFNISAQFKGL